MQEFIQVGLQNTSQDRRVRGAVLGTAIDVVDWSTALSRIAAWAEAHESRIVCICNSHSVVTSTQDAHFKNIIESADMATPDGAPVASMLRKTGYAHQQRINGPDLMWKYCALAAHRNERIYLYGGQADMLGILQQRLLSAFPGLQIAGAYSPPYRAPTLAEDSADIARINASGAGTVWVSLGCPKQEQWMDRHRGKIHAVMIGVGAAFDYHAGTLQRAPLWMQNAGLEWLYRVIKEPRRLWRRYLVTNTLFVMGAAWQLSIGRWWRDAKQ